MSHEVRHYTIMLLDMIDEGLLDKDKVIQAFTSYMSEYDVEDMMRANDFILEEEDEEEEENEQREELGQ